MLKPFFYDKREDVFTPKSNNLTYCFLLLKQEISEFFIDLPRLNRFLMIEIRYLLQQKEIKRIEKTSSGATFIFDTTIKYKRYEPCRIRKLNSKRKS